MHGEYEFIQFKPNYQKAIRELMGPAKKEHNKSARPVKMWSHFFLYFVL